MSSSEDDGAWCTIESDPALFSALIQGLGATGLHVQELYDLSQLPIDPVYGLVFLFKWTPPGEGVRAATQWPASLFFARQVAVDSCATQALVAILMNLPGDCRAEVGEPLQAFRAITADFSPELRGEAMANHDLLRTNHNAFARPEAELLRGAERDSRPRGDPFHFVSFVGKEGRVWEIDGLKAGPVDHGPAGEDDWAVGAMEIIRTQIGAAQRASPGEIRFSLMAVTLDPIVRLQSQLAIGDEQAGRELEGELARRTAAQKEQHLRHHNLLPFVAELLAVMAERGVLQKYA